MVCFETLILINNKLTPITIKILKIFEPIIFPKEISDNPLIEEEIETLASGALVPIETNVKPITNDGIFNFLAILAEPSTKKSAPLIKKNIPIINKNILKNTSIIMNNLSLS